jgi:hypothetical protein
MTTLAHISRLSAQIRQQESLLAQLIDENNSLEFASLNRQYHFHTSDRPISLSNPLLAVILTSDPSANPDYLSQELSSF